jgi:hypothetical protein
LERAASNTFGIYDPHARMLMLVLAKIAVFVQPKRERAMPAKKAKIVEDGAQCKVVAGTHKGKSGTVRDMKTSKTGAVTITVVQADGERFKTLAKNVVVET